jgi:hypothetical protein
VRRLEGGAPTFVAFTSDVSLGGLCLADCGPLRQGERVEVALTSPSRWKPIVLRAEVCWLRGSGPDGASEAGFRFVDVAEVAGAALAELVAALAFEG